MNRFAIAFAGAALVALAASPVSAQYPPPQGSLTITPSDPTPGVGETITLNVQVSQSTTADLGEPGDVILASFPGAPQAGGASLFQAPPYSCTASVSGGTGATVTPTAFDTDASGAATLSVYTGTSPAILTVGVDCGTASAQAILTVAGGGDDDDDGTATAPAGGSTATVPAGGTAGPTPRPPSTGSGGDSAGDAWTFAGAGLAGLVVAAGAAYIGLRGKARRT